MGGPAAARDVQDGRRRIGLLGFGFIGKYVYERLTKEPELGYDVAFVWNRTKPDVPEALTDLAKMRDTGADLVVEMAHPALSREWGAEILSFADYMPLSVTALADELLEQTLRQACAASGRRLYIPHGALVGTDSLVEARANWAAVTITFRKHPRNIDFANVSIDPASINGPTTIYDGPARGIAALFPRNVNTMVTCGLATVGLDVCRAVLIADPSLTTAIAEVEAIGRDGAELRSYKSEPAIGVSGTGMLVNQLGSILRVGRHAPGLHFV